MFSISGMVHFRSKALERTILKICVVVVSLRVGKGKGKEGLRETDFLDVDAVAGGAEDETCSHSFREATCLLDRLDPMAGVRNVYVIVPGC
jgi:hypothetical protein